MKHKFLDLGRQPLANGFLTTEQFADEYFYNLGVTFDDVTQLVSLSEFVDPPLMFNERYPYRASGSATMREHFSQVAAKLRTRFNPTKILEIGSNDGVFLKNFSTNKYDCVGVEPCSNFAFETRRLGFHTLSSFWDTSTARKVETHFSTAPHVIFSANCFCHIPDVLSALSACRDIMSPHTVLVLEDPTLYSVIGTNCYPQFYDEHAHVFSITSLANLMYSVGLRIFDVEYTSVHGGSHRVYACLQTSSAHGERPSVEEAFTREMKMELGQLKTYQQFARNVTANTIRLSDAIEDYVEERGFSVASYGATSKSTTTFNWCKLGTNLISFISDSTPEKQGLYSPGMHIPVITPTEARKLSPGVYYLAAFNFEDEIIRKERAFLEAGGVFISDIPYVRVVGKEALT